MNNERLEELTSQIQDLAYKFKLILNFYELSKGVGFIKMPTTKLESIIGREELLDEFNYILHSAEGIELSIGDLTIRNYPRTNTEWHGALTPKAVKSRWFSFHSFNVGDLFGDLMLINPKGQVEMGDYIKAIRNA